MTVPHSNTPSESPSSLIADGVLHYLLALMAGLYLAGVAGLFCGLNISPVTGVSGVLLGLLLARLIRTPDRGWAAMIFTMAFTAMAVLASGWFFDYSWDGLAIHKPAITQFLHGWNPYRDGSSQNGVNFWSAVYPKASWICSAQLAALAGNLESGKAVNLIAIAAAGLSAWRFLRPRFPAKPHLAMIGAGLIGLNPVAVYQAPTYYVDGLLASLVTILLFSLAHHLTKPNSRFAWFETGVTVMLLINLKFTGLVYACVILAVAGLMIVFRHPIRTTVRFSMITAGLVLFSLFVCGKTPYLDNVLARRHFFYPLFGENKVDIIDLIKPANLVNRDRISSFFIDNFSKSQPVRAPESTTLRLPFDLTGITRDWHDPESGGFGPLFAEAILAAGLIGILFAIRREPRFGAAGVFLAVAILASGFINPEAWWARYSPQLFLLPPLVALFAVRQSVLPSRIAGAVGLSLLAVNIVIVGYLSTIPKRGMSARWHKSVKEMRRIGAESGAPVQVELNEHPFIAVQLRKAGVNIVEVTTTEVDRRKSIPGTLNTCFWQPGSQ